MRFRISLLHIEPTIWRLIDLPADCTFWDLHVATQDAMGWHDEHLHAFELGKDGVRASERLGLSLPGSGDGIQPDWEVRVADRLAQPGDAAVYIYDFGDFWRHTVELVEAGSEEPTEGLSRCVGGERACPPEDCGGEPGYEELLEVMADPEHEAYADRVAWLKRIPGGHWPFDPEAFDPAGVVFRDPVACLEAALQALRR
jgi:Plasmid pRiA4b ORF-3-like protein